MSGDVLSKTLIGKLMKGLEGEEPFALETFFTKMLQAKKLEIEALEALIPKNGKANLYNHLKAFTGSEESDPKPIRKVTLDE